MKAVGETVLLKLNGFEFYFNINFNVTQFKLYRIHHLSTFLYILSTVRPVYKLYFDLYQY